MILATGGLELGATSTRSRSASCASRRATSIFTTPTCSPAGPTRRTSGTRIRSFVRGSLMRVLLYSSCFARREADAARRRERKIHAGSYGITPFSTAAPYLPPRTVPVGTVPRKRSAIDPVTLMKRYARVGESPLSYQGLALGPQ